MRIISYRYQLWGIKIFIRINTIKEVRGDQIISQIQCVHYYDFHLRRLESWKPRSGR